VNLYKAFKVITVHFSLSLSMATVFPICFILVMWFVNIGSDLEAHQGRRVSHHRRGKEGGERLLRQTKQTTKLLDLSP
jgi:hypothetical protein